MGPDLPPDVVMHIAQDKLTLAFGFEVSDADIGFYEVRSVYYARLHGE